MAPALVKWCCETTNKTNIQATMEEDGKGIELSNVIRWSMPSKAATMINVRIKPLHCSEPLPQNAFFSTRC